MTLLQKQQVFTRLVALLIIEAAKRGYETTFSETYRSPEEAARLAKLGKGIKTSLHTKRLAVDLNLFKDGKYLTKTEDYKSLGDFWESLSSSSYTCHWGGRFGDGNHFSIGHGGTK